MDKKEKELEMSLAKIRAEKDDLVNISMVEAVSRSFVWVVLTLFDFLRISLRLSVVAQACAGAVFVCERIRTHLSDFDAEQVT